MDYVTITLADRLEHDRAAALDRENARLRSLVDRGVTLAPEHPVVTAIRNLGLWLRGSSHAAPGRPLRWAT